MSEEEADRPYRPPESTTHPDSVTAIMEKLFPFEVRVRFLGACQLMLGTGAAAVTWPELVLKFWAYAADPVHVRAPLDVHKDGWIYVLVALLLLVSGPMVITLSRGARVLGMAASCFSLCFPPFGLLMAPAGLFLLGEAQGKVIFSPSYRLLRSSRPRPELVVTLGFIARGTLWAVWVFGGLLFFAVRMGWA